MIRALVFDFDGLIVDTESPDLLAWREAYQEHGQELALETWAQVIGTREHGFDAIEHLERLVGAPVDRPRLKTSQVRRSLELTRVQPLLPGVAGLVGYARTQEIKLAIASSSPHPWVDAQLAQRGLDGAFGCICCGDDVTRTKPYPDLYLAALDCLGVSADQTVALEDSPNGIAAARAAGIYVVAVPNPITTRLDLGAADMLLDSLEAMAPAELIEQLSSDLSGRAGLRSERA